VLFCPIEREKRFLVFPHPEGGTIIGPRDDFYKKKVPMSLEGIFIRSKQLGDPGAVGKGYPALLQTSIGTKNIQEEG
jgi:hypothetical protein